MINIIKYLFSFSGESTRSEYLKVFLGLILFAGVISTTMLLLNYYGNFKYLFYVVLAILNLANASKRLNDLNKNSAFLLLMFVPIIQLIFMLYLCFAPGKKRP